MVTSVNAQIKSLAPVLNSPFVTSGHSASSSVEHMVKWDGANFYVFAGRPQRRERDLLDALRRERDGDRPR